MFLSKWNLNVNMIFVQICYKLSNLKILKINQDICLARYLSQSQNLFKKYLNNVLVKKLCNIFN